MKPIAIFVLVAAVTVATVAASAKNATAPGNTDERMISGVAGAEASAETSKRTVAARSITNAEQPGKPEVRKDKIKPKPNDPN